MSPLEELIRRLPAELQREIESYARQLEAKYRLRSNGKPELTWRGALRDMREEFTSVDLQHEISRWWGD